MRLLAFAALVILALALSFALTRLPLVFAVCGAGVLTGECTCRPR